MYWYHIIICKFHISSIVSITIELNLIKFHIHYIRYIFVDSLHMLLYFPGWRAGAGWKPVVRPARVRLCRVLENKVISFSPAAQAQYIRPLRAWIQKPTACTRLFCMQAAARGRGVAAVDGHGCINIIFIDCYVANYNSDWRMCCISTQIFC